MTVLCSVTANHLGLVRVQAEALADHPLAAGDEAAARAVLGLVRGLGRAQHHLTSSISVQGVELQTINRF